jgi:hypothetical protein
MKSIPEYHWTVHIVAILITGKYYWSAEAKGCDYKIECRTLSGKQTAVNKWKQFAKANFIKQFTII